MPMSVRFPGPSKPPDTIEWESLVTSSARSAPPFNSRFSPAVSRRHLSDAQSDRGDLARQPVPW